MNIFDAMFLLGFGMFSEMKRKFDELVNKGKISQEEAQRMFDDMVQDENLREHLSPLPLSLAFSVYTNRKISELLEDLKRKGRLSSEETKKYYRKYLFNVTEHQKNISADPREYMTYEDLSNLLIKLESIEEIISGNELKKGEDAK